MPKPRPKKNKSIRNENRRRSEHTGIADLTTFVVSPYIEGLVAVLMIWLVLNGIIGKTTAIIMGIILGIILAPLIFTVFRQQIANLLNQRTIARPGCLAGLFTYPISVIIAFIALWNSKSFGVFVTFLVLVPVFCFVIAFIVTSRIPTRDRR